MTDKQTSPPDEKCPEGPLTASVEKLRHELDRWLEVAVSQGERALDAFGLRTAGKGWCPQLEIIEKSEEIHVIADLPGVDPNNVDITLAGNMLTIEGEKPTREPEEGELVHSDERTHGKFSRSIPMPAAVNPEEVSAVATNGVLCIRLVKAESAKARQIPVNVKHKAAEEEPK